MAAAAATLVATEEDKTLVLKAEGEWLLATAAELDRRLRQLDPPPHQPIAIDLGGLDRIDSAGAWLLLRAELELTARGNPVELRNLDPTFAPLFEQVRAGGSLSPVAHPRPDHHTLVGFLARLGAVTLGLCARTYRLLGFFGLVCATMMRLTLRPGRLRLTAMVAQMEQTGVNALAIVGLLAVGILRELGVLMTAIIIAGRSGSAFTAEIGTMRVTEEIDAMRTLGLDPVEVLVVPRLLALLLTLPMLTLYADLMGLLGGSLMARAALGIAFPEFLSELRNAVGTRTLWIGVVKAPFFAAIIAMIGCYE